MGKRLFIGNLPFTTTEDELRQMFAKAGVVESAAVVSDRVTGKSRGFGFVEMGSDGDAEQAIATLNGSSIGGRAINVSEAHERTGGR